MADRPISHLSLTRTAFRRGISVSIKEECLDQMILFSEESLRHVVSEYVEHYHWERNHQGLESRIIQPQFRDSGAGEVKRRERLGGLLNFYCREAA